MGWLVVVLYVLVVVSALLLIGLILIQPSKGGGMGAAFGGVGETVLGAHAGSHLTKATVVLTTVFFAAALALATLIGRGGRDNGALAGVDQALQALQAETPAAEAPAAPAQSGQ